jgi:hypothetical protein
VLGAVGGVATAVLAIAIVGRWQALLPWGIALLGAPYAASLLLRDGGVDALAPLYAAALLLTAELSYWASEQGPFFGGRPTVLRRLGSLLGLGVGTAAAAAAVLAVSEAGAGSGVLLELVGVLAASGAVALVAWLAWQERVR